MPHSHSQPGLEELIRHENFVCTALRREFGDRSRWAVLATPVLAKHSLGLVPLALGTAVVAVAGGWFVHQFFFSEPTAAVVALPEWNALAAAPAAQVELSALQDPVEAPPTERVPVDVTSSDPATSPTVERHLPPAVLLDRAYYSDYERATFSFNHGLRDDPDRKLVQGNWGLLLNSGMFRVSLVVDDQSCIADLGSVRPEQISTVALDGLAFRESAEVQVGHSYFVWTRDTSTDLASLVYVREHERGKSCVFDWYTTDGSGRAQGSLRDDRKGEPLADFLVGVRREACGRQAQLKEPLVVLQARMGAGGGNTHMVHMNGQFRRFDEVSSDPLDLISPISIREPSRCYFQGGWIPADRVFVVERISYTGTPGRDSNGRGKFVVVVGGEMIVELDHEAEPVRDVWSGRIELHPGDEMETYLAVSNSTAGEVILEGSLVEREARGSFGAPNEGFFVTAPPPSVGPDAADFLTSPRVVLQARSGAGGGNPNRIDMRGMTSIYVDSVEERPLDFLQPPDRHDDSRVYFEGGYLPEDWVFVVTGASWNGTSAGDSNGHGELTLVVANQTLVEERDSELFHQGTWSGSLRILPGEESRTYLEIANTSSADVLLTGYFEERKR